MYCPTNQKGTGRPGTQLWPDQTGKYVAVHFWKLNDAREHYSLNILW